MECKDKVRIIYEVCHQEAYIQKLSNYDRCNTMHVKIQKQVKLNFTITNKLRSTLKLNWL